MTHRGAVFVGSLTLALHASDRLAPTCSVKLLHLGMRDSRVLGSDKLLILREIVERTFVGLSVAMLRTVYISALTGDLHDAHALSALPTLI